jgi:hypothetical protein
VLPVTFSLLQTRGGCSFALRHQLTLDASICQQLPNCAGNGSTVDGVSVEISQDEKMTTDRQAAFAASVIVNPLRLFGSQIVDPKRISSAFRQPLRSSGPSNAGGVG